MAMKMARIVIFLVACMVMALSGADAPYVVQGLDGIDEKMGELGGIVQKSRDINKIRMWGDTRFAVETLKEIQSPLDVTNRFTLRDKNIGTSLYMHYEPSAFINFNVGMSVSMGLGSGATPGFGMIGTDFYLNSLLKTLFGNYSLFLGGPWWVGSSSLSFSSAGYQYKSAPFDRNSWDGIWSDYAWVSGSGIRNADQRGEGARGIKGIRLEGNNIPGGIWGTFFIGQQEGQGSKNFNFLHYGRFDRDFNETKLGLAYGSIVENGQNRQNPDRINTAASIYTKGPLFKKLKFFLEAGFSYAEIFRYLDVNNILVSFDPVYGFAVIGSLSTSFNKLGFLRNISLNLEPYYIAPDYIGELTAVVPTHKSIPYGYKQDNPNPQEITLYNNRYGGSLKTSFSVFGFNAQLLLGQTFSILPTTNMVGIGHDLDHYQWWLVFDQMGHWYSVEGMDPLYWGPLAQSNRPKANLGTYWQGASESLVIKDTVKRKRHYNIITFNLGYDISKVVRFLPRTYAAFNTYFKSINNGWNVFPVIHWTDDIVWGSYFDFFLSTGIIRKVDIIGYYALESWKSEQTSPAVDQKEYSWGLGLNYIPVSNLGIFMRFKRFVHTDILRPLNDIKGIWAQVEVKVSF